MKHVSNYLQNMPASIVDAIYELSSLNDAGQHLSLCVDLAKLAFANNAVAADEAKKHKTDAFGALVNALALALDKTFAPAVDVFIRQQNTVSNILYLFSDLPASPFCRSSRPRCRDRGLY